MIDFIIQYYHEVPKKFYDSSFPDGSEIKLPCAPKKDDRLNLFGSEEKDRWVVKRLIFQANSPIVIIVIDNWLRQEDL